MIELVDRGDKSLIRFTPRYQYRKLPTIECELINGYRCPICSNVFQALYFIDAPFDLEKYEETRVLSQGEKNAGDLLKIVPNFEDKGNYRVIEYDLTDVKAQQIVLKNHVVNWKGVNGNRDDYFEVGERCCSFTSVISLVAQNMARDLAVVAGYSLTAGNRYKDNVTEPTPEFITEWLKNSFSWENQDVRAIKAVGASLPALMIKRATMKNPFTSVLTHLYKAWDQKVLQEKLAREAMPKEQV